MEDDLEQMMCPKTIKSKNNNIFENRRRTHFFEKGRRPQFFLNEDDLNLFENGRRPQTNNTTTKQLK